MERCSGSRKCVTPTPVRVDLVQMRSWRSTAAGSLCESQAMRLKCTFTGEGLFLAGGRAFGSVGGGAAAAGAVSAGGGVGSEGGGTGTVTEGFSPGAGSPETVSGAGGTGGGPAGSLGVCAALSIATKSPAAQMGKSVRPAIRVVLWSTGVRPLETRASTGIADEDRRPSGPPCPMAAE